MLIGRYAVLRRHGMSIHFCDGFLAFRLSKSECDSRKCPHSCLHETNQFIHFLLLTNLRLLRFYLRLRLPINVCDSSRRQEGIFCFCRRLQCSPERVVRQFLSNLPRLSCDELCQCVWLLSTWIWSNTFDWYLFRSSVHICVRRHERDCACAFRVVRLLIFKPRV